MIVLGLTAPISWNSAAAIVKDGKLIAAVEEERFINLKHAPRIIPTNSIEYCLQSAHVEASEIQAVAFGFRSPMRYYLRTAKENIIERDGARLIREVGAFAEYQTGLVRLKEWMIARGFRFKGPGRTRIFYVPHHIAHAASAFRCSGLQESNIITLDGQGEDDSGILAYGDKSGIRILRKIGHHQSLGMVYGNVTGMLGFKPHSHEGKVMALAAWGKEVLDTTDIWEASNNGYRLHRNWLKILKTKYGPERRREEEIDDRHRNLALTVQKFTEKCGEALARSMWEKTQCGNFCLAGGVALNCDMNGKIWQLPFVENLFIQPASNDTGTAIGAALEIAAQHGDRTTCAMTHAFWGPAYSNEQIERVLSETKWKYEKVNDIEDQIAEQLASGKIVGWFQGRLEIGPRALGNRSILGHPAIDGMKDKINGEVKHREAWRPFAPSVLHDYGSEYFKKYCYHPFMILAFDTTERGRKDLSQAIHVDGTARPQSVTKESNARYYDMISRFANRTGIGGVLNTSFNDKDKPIVNTPREGVSVFASTGIDLLAIGDFIIQKNQ